MWRRGEDEGGKVIRGGEGGVMLDGQSLRAMRGVPTGQQVQLCM